MNTKLSMILTLASLAIPATSFAAFDLIPLMNADDSLGQAFCMKSGKKISECPSMTLAEGLCMGAGFSPATCVGLNINQAVCVVAKTESYKNCRTADITMPEAICTAGGHALKNCKGVKLPVAICMSSGRSAQTCSEVE